MSQPKIRYKGAHPKDTAMPISISVYSNIRQSPEHSLNAMIAQK